MSGVKVGLASSGADSGTLAKWNVVELNNYFAAVLFIRQRYEIIISYPVLGIVVQCPDIVRTAEVATKRNALLAGRNNP